MTDWQSKATAASGGKHHSPNARGGSALLCTLGITLMLSHYRKAARCGRCMLEGQKRQEKRSCLASQFSPPCISIRSGQNSKIQYGRNSSTDLKTTRGFEVRPGGRKVCGHREETSVPITSLNEGTETRVLPLTSLLVRAQSETTWCRGDGRADATHGTGGAGGVYGRQLRDALPHIRSSTCFTNQISTRTYLKYKRPCRERR